MRYKSFTIQNYRAVVSPITINLNEQSLIPLIGLNECGKTTILQAIFGFDYINDNEYEGRHLTNTTNLYETRDSDPLITAKIQISHSNLLNCWNETIVEARDKTAPNIEEEKNEEDEENLTKEELQPFHKPTFTGTIRVTRNLTSKKYSVQDLSGVDEVLQDSLSRNILRQMPYILYNDDFQDRPPSKIVIPTKESQELTGWPAIYERLFKVTDPTYSLFTTAQLQNTQRKDSIVSDVQATLNDTLAKAWKTFLLDRNRNMAVRLKLTNNTTIEPTLEISIVENIGTKERFFEVADRSKGFLWFFNFVMKLEFNPKVSGNEKDTVYLLDEPGSYLHSAAQKKLCTKLKKISKKNGNVIFCTHSHHLLDPEQIPVNSIRIVSKSSKKQISITSVSEFRTSTTKRTALQPVYEALQISPEEFLSKDKPVLMLEGIYDRYAVKLFLPSIDQFNVCAGADANSVSKNIPLMNAYGLVYIAVWDNDEEGRKVKSHATSSFGPIEAKKFDLLPSRENSKDRRMEDMFDPTDICMLREELDLPENSHYEGILVTLFYSPKAIRSQLVKKVSSATKNNFETLQVIINKRLDASRALRNAE